jgi:hypothetical protein
MVMILDSGSRDMSSNLISSSKFTKMKYKIFVYATATEFEFYMDNESSYFYNVEISEFESEFESESILIEFLRHLNSNNSP